MGRMLVAVAAEIDVEVIEISEHEWRVRDSSRPERDAGSLCGFVSRNGEVFEVFRIGDPLTRTYFDSLAAAVHFLAAMQAA